MSPRTQQQLKEVREESKKKILDAALALFAAKGYHSTSIKDISIKAGVSKGLIYNYFEKKEDLVTQIVLQNVQESEVVLEQILQLQDPRARLRYLIDLGFLFIVQNRERFKLLLAMSLQLDAFPEVQDMIKNRYQASLPLYSNLLTFLYPDPAQARQEGIALAAMLDGLGLQYFILDNEEMLQEMRKYAYRRFQLGEPSPSINLSDYQQDSP